MEEQSPNFARAAINGTAWRYLAFFSGKLMVFASMVVLARLLTKDDFGVVGFAVTTIGFLDVMSDLGVMPALIYHPKDDDTSVTAFWLGLLIGVLMFGLTWIAAPLVGLFFQDPRAIPVTRVLALTYPINALGATHQAVLQKNLAFKREFLPNLIQSVAKGLGSIFLALLGIGAWSMIGGQLIGTVAGAIFFWVVARWWPTFSFNTKIARSLLNYGMKIVGVDIIGIILVNIDYLLVGRYLGAASLGVYTIAFRMPDLIILQFARILSGVIFPIYTRMRDVPGSLTKGFAMTTRYVSLVTVPLGFGLAVLAKPFILAVFTDKWTDAIPVVTAISIYAVLVSLAYNVGSVYKAEGRPQVLTWLSLARLLMVFPGLLWATNVVRSIVAVGWVQVAFALFGVILNFYVATKLLKISPMVMVNALKPAFISGFFMVCSLIIVLAITGKMSPWIQLFAGLVFGAATYIISLWVFQRDVVDSARRQVLAALGKAA